jgi:hypothetical protein
MNAPFTTPIRPGPHNVEAEQALLGAILVNNEAFYRVSDFLEPKHFFEPIHQCIFELTAGLIRADKVATPVTLKTFLPGDADIAGLPVNQYLARLAAEATAIINAEDYGRTMLGGARGAPTAIWQHSMEESSVSFRSKCRPSSSRPASSASEPRLQPTKSAVVILRR